jgi:hypothetical protein
MISVHTPTHNKKPCTKEAVCSFYTFGCCSSSTFFLARYSLYFCFEFRSKLVMAKLAIVSLIVSIEPFNIPSGRNRKKGGSTPRVVKVIHPVTLFPFFNGTRRPITSIEIANDSMVTPGNSVTLELKLTDWMRKIGFPGPTTSRIVISLVSTGTRCFLFLFLPPFRDSVKSVSQIEFAIASVSCNHAAILFHSTSPQLGR